MVTKEFITAGKAIFTIEVPEQYQHLGTSHYTFKVCHKAKTDKYDECYFVSILTGPDNTSDYTYVGKLGPNGEVWRTAKSSLPETSWPWKLLTRTLYRIFAGEGDAIEAAAAAAVAR